MKTNNCQQCDKEFFFYESRSAGKFCSNKCQQRYQYEHTTIPKILRGVCGERKTLRKYLIDVRGYVCSNCKITEWLGQPTPLEIDHIDGDAGNDMPHNIRLLCPNCHAMMPTSRGRNRGRGRKARGLSVN